MLAERTGSITRVARALRRSRADVARHLALRQPEEAGAEREGVMEGLERLFGGAVETLLRSIQIVYLNGQDGCDEKREPRVAPSRLLLSRFRLAPRFRGVCLSHWDVGDVLVL